MNNSYLSEYSYVSTNTSQGQLVHLNHIQEFQQEMNKIQVQSQLSGNQQFRRASNNWFRSESDNSEKSYNPSSLQQSSLISFQENYETVNNQHSSQVDYFQSSGKIHQSDQQKKGLDQKNTPIKFQNLQSSQPFVFPSNCSKSSQSSLSKYENLLQYYGDEKSLDSFKKSMEKYSFHDHCLKSFSLSRIDSRLIEDQSSNCKIYEQKQEYSNEMEIEIEIPSQKSVLPYSIQDERIQDEKIQDERIKDQQILYEEQRLEIKENIQELNKGYNIEQYIELGKVIIEEKSENEQDENYQSRQNFQQFSQSVKIEEKKEKKVKRNRKQNGKKKEERIIQNVEFHNNYQYENNQQVRRNPPRKRRNPGNYRPEDFMTNIEQYDEPYQPEMKDRKFKF